MQNLPTQEPFAVQPRPEMMLRSRNTNVINQQAGAGGAGKPNADHPNKRAATKQLQEKAAAVNRENSSDEPSNGEPKPKRAVLSELRNQLSSSLLIDSTRKGHSAKSKDDTTRKTRLNSSSEHVIEKNDSIIVLEDVAEEKAVTRSMCEVDPAPEYDYDAENIGDPFNVPDFAFDIFAYYKMREANFKVDDYLARHPRLTKDSRAVLIDWMIEIQETFELNHETLYLAVKLVDLYLMHTKKAASRNDLQLIACAAVFVASKYDERQPPLIDDFLYVAEDAFTKPALEEMERELLRTVAFDLGSPLSYRYARRFAKTAKADMQVLTLSRFILETSLMFYEFVPASESKMAAGAFYLALKMFDANATWTPIMQKYSGYTAEEMEPWVWELNHMMHIRQSGKGVNAKLLTAFQKYSHEVFFKSAEIPLLADKYELSRGLCVPN